MSVPKCDQSTQTDSSGVDTATQTVTPEVKTVAVDCKVVAAPALDFLQADRSQSSTTTSQSLSDNFETESSDSETESDYYPESTEEDDSTSEDDTLYCDSDVVREEIGADCSPKCERILFVFLSCLYTLLASCVTCRSRCKVYITRKAGTLLIFEQQCLEHSKHTWSWATQPLHGQLGLGNLKVAAAILFSGCSPTKALNAFRHADIPAFTLRTFNMLQRYYLIPSIVNVWTRHQQQLLVQLKASALRADLGGDARCDSPGHSAKYSSYSVMNLQTKKIIHVQLIQSNEASSSAAMELLGLKRSMLFLDEEHVDVRSFTTDRHPSIKKYLREERPLVKHWFDVWHVAKGVYKKIQALAKKAAYRELSQWAAGISNHLYWCISTSAGKASLVKEKWLSMLNHIANVHRHKDNNEYKRCSHGDLEDRLWIKAGSRTHKGLAKIVTSPFLMRDIGNLSPAEQTSTIECFHKVICFFAPKSQHFFYNAMKARTYLAALHFNENVSRRQATTSVGEEQWIVSYPKYKYGQGVSKAVKVPIHFNYVAELKDEVFQLRYDYPSYSRATALVLDQPPNLTSSVTKQNKSFLVANHKSRFNTGLPK